MKRSFLAFLFVVCCFAAVSLPVPAADAEEHGSLPAELREDFNRLVEETVRWRGLDAGSEVPAGVQDAPALRRRLEAELDEEIPAEVMSPMGTVLQRFGLIPEGSDLREMLLDLLSSQVAGYFDPDTGEITMVENAEGRLAGAIGEELDETLAARIEESLLVHEIDHYLQDRHFDLEALISGESFSDDRQLARQSLVEGDATLVMTSYLLDFAVERLPMFDALFREMVKDPELMLAMSPDLPGGEELAAAPRYLRENLLFPYVQGMAFCVRLRQAGGQKLLDHAFAEDSPRSSEQILHPGKWLEERDVPVAIELAGLSAALPGWDLAVDGSWGELNTALVLGVRGGDDDRARAAAEGWGGDIFALYRRGRKATVVWITEWDTEADAGEFHDLAGEAFAGWQVESAGPRRVVLHDAVLSGQKARALQAALRDAEATRPESPDLDLAALGITDADRPEPFGLADSVELLGSPFLQALLEEGMSAEQWGMVEEQLGSPESQAELERMLENFDAEDFEKLQQSPAVREMIEKMAAETPPIVREGNVFRVAEIGFQATVPDGDGWTALDPQPGPGSPLARFEAPEGEGEKGGWGLAAVVIELPMPVPLEAVAAGIEASLPFADVVQESQASFEGPPTGLEVVYTGSQGGQQVRLIQRLYSVAGFVLSIQAIGTDDHWDAVEDAVNSFFDSISFESEAPQ